MKGRTRNMSGVRIGAGTVCEVFCPRDKAVGRTEKGHF